MKSLKTKLLLSSFGASIALSAMFFLPAGTVKFWQAWAYLVMVFAFWIFVAIYFYAHDRELLERRMQKKEKLGEQQRIMAAVYVVIGSVYIFPGFDHRFAWSKMPAWLSSLGLVLVLAGYVLVFWVMKYNSYASRIIELAAGQKVVSTGPYAIVRHPMYFGMGVTCLAAPLALGSYYALPVGALIIPLLILRLLKEEKMLRGELSGYPEYCEQTRFRLIPYVW